MKDYDQGAAVFQDDFNQGYSPSREKIPESLLITVR